MTIRATSAIVALLLGASTVLAQGKSPPPPPPSSQQTVASAPPPSPPLVLDPLSLATTWRGSRISWVLASVTVSMVGDGPRVAFAGNGFVTVSIAPPVAGGTYTVGVEVEGAAPGPQETIDVSDASGLYVKSTTCPVTPGVVRCTGTFTVPAKGLDNNLLKIAISWRSPAPGPRIRKILVSPP